MDRKLATATIVAILCIFAISLRSEGRRTSSADQADGSSAVQEHTVQREVTIVRCVKDIPVGAIVEMDALSEERIEESKRPAGAVDDAWIAFARVAQCSIKKGQPILYRHVIPEEQWKNDNQYVKIVYCIKDVPAGATIPREALAEIQVLSWKCPAKVLSSLWIGIGRTARSPLVKGETVGLYQVFTEHQWRSALHLPNGGTEPADDH
jgi:hypothetical protein